VTFSLSLYDCAWFRENSAKFQFDFVITIQAHLMCVRFPCDCSILTKKDIGIDKYYTKRNVRIIVIWRRVRVTIDAVKNQ
jgi:hypothetical protein